MAMAIELSENNVLTCLRESWQSQNWINIIEHHDAEEEIQRYEYVGK